MWSLAAGSRTLLVVVLTVAVVGKLRRPRELAETLPSFGVPPRFARLVGPLVIGLEAAAALLVVVVPRAGCLLAAALLVAFSAGIMHALVKAPGTRCRCFGAQSRPLGRAHLVRNLIVLAAALAGLGHAEAAAVPALLGGALAGVAIVRWDDLVFVFSPPAIARK